MPIGGLDEMVVLEPEKHVAIATQNVEGESSTLPESHPVNVIAEKPVTLYHGTGLYYEGVPSRGYKDVLRTGHVSMSSDSDMAEMFAGGSRDSRIYSVDIPTSEILDLRVESKKLGEEGKWDELATLVKEAGESGKYKAVAIQDITTGGDATEFRLVGQVPEEQWQVRPTGEKQDYWGKTDDTIQRFNAGEKVGIRERGKALSQLKEEFNMNADVYDIIRSEGKEKPDVYPPEHVAAFKVKMDRDLAEINSLQSNRPPDRKEEIADYAENTSDGEDRFRDPSADDDLREAVQDYQENRQREDVSHRQQPTGTGIGQVFKKAVNRAKGGRGGHEQRASRRQ